MAVAAGGEPRAPRSGVGRIEVPAQAAAGGHVGRRLHRSHQPHRFGPKHADPVEFALVQHHATVPGDIGRGGEQSGVARHTAHPPRARVVHHAAHRPAILDLRRGDARQLGLGRIEPGVLHSQRAVYLPRQKLIERLAGDAAHHLAQEDRSRVAVDELLARTRAQLLGARKRNGRFRAAPVGLEVDVRTQTRGVGEELADGDGLFAVALELGQVVRDRRIELQPALLHKTHDGRRAGHHLRQRSGIEQGVLGHRFLRREHGAKPVGFAVGHTVALEPQHPARTPLVGDRRFNRRVHLREFGGVERRGQLRRLHLRLGPVGAAAGRNDQDERAQKPKDKDAAVVDWIGNLMPGLGDKYSGRGGRAR